MSYSSPDSRVCRTTLSRVFVLRSEEMQPRTGQLEAAIGVRTQSHSLVLGGEPLLLLEESSDKSFPAVKHQ